MIGKFGTFMNHAGDLMTEMYVERVPECGSMTRVDFRALKTIPG